MSDKYMVLLPRKATDFMKKAGEDTPVMHSWSKRGEFIDAESAGDVYEAMVKAFEKERK